MAKPLAWLLAVFYLLPLDMAKGEPAHSGRTWQKNKVDMVYIKAGQFIMGSDTGEEDERPVHTVYLDGYWIGRYEVTNGEYRAFINERGYNEPIIWNDTSINPTDKHPVIGVRWEDAVNFAKWMKERTGMPYRLPTEAEWEKAARGTDGRKYPWGNSHPDKTRANFVIEKDGYRFVAPAGSFKKGVSPYGIFDMAGNVWEWCLDWYSETYYRTSPFKNPRGPEKGAFHVARGGSWVDHPHYIRTSMRNSSFSSSYRYGFIGFRLAMEDVPPMPQ